MTEPRYDEETGNLFEVTVTGMVELAFDTKPTDKELRYAALDNLLYLIQAIGIEQISTDDTSIGVVAEWTGDSINLYATTPNE